MDQLGRTLTSVVDYLQLQSHNKRSESDMYYGSSEARTPLKYIGADPRVSSTAPGVGQLISCLARSGDGADLKIQYVAQGECLQDFAQAGWRLDDEAFEVVCDPQGLVMGGDEHDVFYEPRSGRVIKVTKNPQSFGAQGSAYGYLRNQERCNAFFADSIRFEGILETAKGDALVISQPFIKGEPASPEQIIGYFSAHGFKRVRQDCFELELPDGRQVLIADARPANVIEQEGTGLLLPIDVQVIVSGESE